MLDDIIGRNVTGKCFLPRNRITKGVSNDLINYLKVEIGMKDVRRNPLLHRRDTRFLCSNERTYIVEYNQG